MERRSLWLVLLALAGCDDETKRDAMPTATPPQKGLSIDDAAVATHPALAIGTEGETSLRIVVPLAPLSCEALRAAYPDRPVGEYVDFWLRRPVEADGRPGLWAIRSAFLQDHRAGRGLTTRAALVDDVVAAADGKELRGLELALQDRARLLNWTGNMSVRDCGRAPRPETDRPQPDLDVTIAGETIAIHGATIRPEAGKLYLRFTRAPHACSTVFTEGYDFYLDVALEGDPPRVAFAALQGDVFPGDPAGSKGKESFVVKSEDDLRGTGEIDVTLGGKLGLGDYTVSIEGTAKVLRCTPR